MLPPFIIDQIRKREEDEQAQRAPLELELPVPGPLRREPRPADDEPKRGVVIIDLG